MAKCSICGARFKIADARSEYNEEYGDLGYDEEFPDHDVCGQCALEETGSAMSAGLAMDFCLMTGRSPDEMPDDWEMHDSDDYHSYYNT